MDSATAQALLGNLERFGVSRSSLREHLLAPLGYRAGYGEYERDYVANALLAERRARTVAEVVATLDAAGIPVVLLKGVSYAAHIYGDPAERPMADIDVMVPVRHHRDARHRLCEVGFRERVERGSESRFHHAVTLQRGNEMLDLHRRIAQPGRVRIDLAEVWRAARPCPERADGALRLALVDEALFHFVNLSRTQLYAPGISYVDGALLLSRLDATQRQQLDRRARRYRVRRAVDAAIDMTRALTEPDYTRRLDPITSRLLPSPREVAAYQLPSRSLQVIRKLALLDGPRAAAAFLAVAAAERLSLARD